MDGQLDASRVCNGTFGKVYIDGEWQSHVNECIADVEVDVKDITTCGSDWVGHKCGAKKGTGSIKGFHVTSKMIQQGFKRFELLTSLEDPEAYGFERIRLKNCMATKINLINFKGGEVVEEETPIVFNGYELVDPIEAQ
ncbi:phage portal protein [Clostridium botulinum]|uniref:Phage tail tube protein n=1 Tax=Clostridium botulinum TaxID=1491 RepID=A0ABD7CGV3_CLOBO|nr:phage tail tube protein [Clostridium botulinum]KGO14285.1 phage portal protein [Clostridium botulinum]QRI52261.1 phage tail tube protein [Clostridium botulinum]